MEPGLHQLGESLAVVQWMTHKTPWMADLSLSPAGPVVRSFSLAVDQAVSNYLRFVNYSQVGKASFPGKKCGVCEGSGRWKAREAVTWLHCTACNGSGGEAVVRHVLGVVGLSRPLLGGNAVGGGSRIDGLVKPEWLLRLSLSDVFDAWVSAGQALRGLRWDGAWVDGSWWYRDVCDACKSSRNPELVPLWGRWSLPFVFVRCRHRIQQGSWGAVLNRGLMGDRALAVDGDQVTRGRCFDVRCSLLSDGAASETMMKFGDVWISGKSQQQIVAEKFSLCRVACEAETSTIVAESEQTGNKT